MAIRNIRIEGDDLLRKRSKSVDKIDERIMVLLDDMYDTMCEQDGVGIAAPQVGVLKRIFIVQVPEEEKIEVINPEIIEQSGSAIDEEACLSVPEFSGSVERATYLKIKGLNRKGEEVTYEVQDFAARVFQHEYDHLEGILYTDKLIEGEQS